MPSVKSGPRYYRVEIAMTLFEEVSVMLQWGISGGQGQTKVHTFDNLREASTAADRFRRRAQRRGYARD
jgi:predicted DNA-binding WGR domain protein